MSNTSTTTTTIARSIAPHHPEHPITVRDLADMSHLLPSGGAYLVRLLGVAAALALINTWSGVQLPIPKRADSNARGAARWAEIAAVIGEPAMQVLAADRGGDMLDIPNCNALRKERRNRAICAQFDQLTGRRPMGEGLSKNAAVIRLGMSNAPITYRQIETILDRPSLYTLAQNNLF
jgi:hypothetical protein